MSLLTGIRQNTFMRASLKLFLLLSVMSIMSSLLMIDQFHGGRHFINGERRPKTEENMILDVRKLLDFFNITRQTRNQSYTSQDVYKSVYKVQEIDSTKYLKRNWLFKPFSDKIHINRNEFDNEYINNNEANEQVYREANDKTDIGKTISDTIIKICLYNIFHGGLKFHARNVEFSKCEYINCEFFEIKVNDTRPIDADALLFQGSRLPNALPVRKNPDQAFIFLGKEAPLNLHFTDLNDVRFRNFFNWTMTYRLDSDIPFPYGQIVPKTSNILTMKNNQQGGCRGNGTFDAYIDNVFTNPEGISGKKYSKIFKRKTKNCAWIVSHCQTSSRREEFVEKMKGVIEVDIFGHCSNRSCEERCENLIISNYKFYLAFENSICRDYITEKAYKWMKKDIIIVVLGSRNYKEHLPKGTFIDVDDFETPETLSEHLLKLGSDEEEYIRMLKRKGSYTLINHKERIQISYCYLCSILNNLHLHRKSIENINDWWNNGVCVRPPSDPLFILKASPRHKKKNRKLTQ